MRGLTGIIILPLILIICHLEVNGQDIARSPSGIDLTLTSKLYRNNGNLDLNTLNEFNLEQPVKFLGVSFSGGFIINNKRNTNGYLGYEQVIPENVQVNDTLNGRINGFNFSWLIQGIDFIKSKKFDLILCGGFNTGRLWINGEDEIRQKNAYFSPVIAFFPRINLGKISIQARVSYDYDITNKNWKRKGFHDAELTPLGRFSSEGLSLSFGVGYLLW